jgi:hypothetical protein
MPDAWTVNHFSLCRPAGTDRSNVPALLRYVADHLETRGPIVVQDLIMGTEVTVEGLVHHVTVYFHPEDAAGGGEVRLQLVDDVGEGRVKHEQSAAGDLPVAP